MHVVTFGVASPLFVAAVRHHQRSCSCDIALIRRIIPPPPPTPRYLLLLLLLLLL